MQKTTSTIVDRLSVARLRSLLVLAIEPTADAVLASDSALTMPASRRAIVPEIVVLLDELVGDQHQSAAGLLEEVCSPSVSVDALHRVKELAKRLIDAAGNDALRDAATVLYHASVAAAFARHGVNLSSRPITERLQLFGDLAATLDPGPLAEVFAAAVRRAV